MDRAIITYCLLILFYTVPNNDSLAVEGTSKYVQRSSSKYSKREVSDTHGQSAISQLFADRDESLSHGDLTDWSILTTPTPCPGGALFCESADDYPKDFIKDRLKKSPVPLMGGQYEEEISKLRQKRRAFNGDSGLSSRELCSSKTQIVYPNKAKSKEGVFQYVVNDEEHKQGVRVEICMKRGEQCDMPGAVISNGYHYTCGQKYTPIFLTVLNHNSSSDTQGIVTMPFEFPSHCSCVVNKEINSEETRSKEEHNTTPVTMSAPSSTAKSVEEKSVE